MSTDRSVPPCSTVCQQTLQCPTCGKMFICEAHHLSGRHRVTPCSYHCAMEREARRTAASQKGTTS